MISNFDIFLFVNKFFKYLFYPEVLDVKSIQIKEENESDTDLDEYISE